YNSSPAALAAALTALQTLGENRRRIAVLGDMMELGIHTIGAHRAAGERAAAICQIIITVGVRAKFIGEAAVEKGFDKKSWWHYDNAEEAAKKLEKILDPNDLILVKGSQSARLERV